jgi:putative ABC transport system permease protein
MPVWSRLRAHAGPWTVVGLLGLALVFVAAAAGPTTRHLEDAALRQMVGGAPMLTRDITMSEQAAVGSAGSAAEMRDTVLAGLPSALTGVVETGWGAQRTTIEKPTRSASLSGEGVFDPRTGLMPQVTLHHVTDLAAEVTMVEGAAPATEPAERPGLTVIEVMAAAAWADRLDLRVGQTYHVLPGFNLNFPTPAEEVDGPTVALRLTGVFAPTDPAGAVWEIDPLLARVGQTYWPAGGGLSVPLLNSVLVTDQQGVDTLFARELAGVLGIETVGRIRFDPSRMDADWVAGARDAVATVIISPALSPTSRLRTGLIELLDEYRRQAAAARAVASVVAAGLVGTGVGLLVLAARIAVDRRRAELSLLRARGASLAAVVGRFLREAVVVAVPAATAGWLLHMPLPGRDDPGFVPGVGVAPLAVAAVALLAVPVTVAAAGRRRLPGRPRGTEGRGELAGYRPSPVRVTMELLVVVLAGLGVLLLYQRGLPPASLEAVGAAERVAGTDPYLAAVPVLIGAAAGLLALRLYPWPLRAAGALAAGRRGAVAFVGLARAGRAAPATALPLLVLVLAVALGGFAGAVTASVAGARDAAAVRAVGADARFEAEGITDQVAASVAGVPGVEVVAMASDQGFVRMGGGVDINIVVVTVDALAYQRILSGIGASVRLPDPVVSAGPGTDPLPVLTWAPVDPGGPLSVELEGVEYPALAVGDVTDLPELASGRPWVLVPRQALPTPPAPTQLLVAGAAADLDAVREVVAGATGAADAVTVTSIPGFQEQLAGSGFNRSLTVVFVIGTVGAALGGLLAVGLALVVQAAARGRALSLLRTMGLSAGQARGLLLVELLPVTALAVAVGAATGVAMPVLLGPALGLTSFTGGAPLPFGLDLGTVLLLGGLSAIFVIGGALVEGSFNRRLGLGQVLRVD